MIKLFNFIIFIYFTFLVAFNKLFRIEYKIYKSKNTNSKKYKKNVDTLREHYKQVYSPISPYFWSQYSPRISQFSHKGPI